MSKQPAHPVLDGERRLFVDRRGIDRRENVTRTFHGAVKHDVPLLSQTEPWERMGGMTASVVYDAEDRVFKAWYMAGSYAEDKQHVQCLALSADGIEWRKPAVSLCEALGSTANNIVVPAEHHDGRDHFETMMKDPMATDERRY